MLSNVSRWSLIAFKTQNEKLICTLAPSMFEKNTNMKGETYQWLTLTSKCEKLYTWQEMQLGQSQGGQTQSPSSPVSSSTMQVHSQFRHTFDLHLHSLLTKKDYRHRINQSLICFTFFVMLNNNAVIVDWTLSGPYTALRLILSQNAIIREREWGW